MNHDDMGNYSHSEVRELHEQLAAMIAERDELEVLQMKILIEESVLRQALETFTHCYAETDRRINERAKLLVELRTALDAAEKVEPVAWMQVEDGATRLTTTKGGNAGVWEPLYLHPQDRDSIIEECAAVCEGFDERYRYNYGAAFAAAIRALKEK